MWIYGSSLKVKVLWFRFRTCGWSIWTWSAYITSFRKPLVCGHRPSLSPILHPAVHQFSWTSLIRYWVSYMSEHQTLWMSEWMGEWMSECESEPLNVNIHIVYPSVCIAFFFFFFFFRNSLLTSLLLRVRLCYEWEKLQKQWGCK